MRIYLKRPDAPGDRFDDGEIVALAESSQDSLSALATASDIIDRSVQARGDE
jgi:hypothetical protein